jgi:aspartate racemase
MHKVADQVSKAVGLPVLHIADATAEAIKLMGLEKVGLLGTKFTMEDEFYRGRLWRNYKIKTIIPNGRDRKIIHRILYSGDCLGMIKANHGEDFKRIINGLLSKGAQGIILGCTELPLMIDQANYDVPLFDTTRLHAEAAAALSLAEEIGTR